MRASFPAWPSPSAAASPPLVVPCSWHRWICHLIACVFVKWLSPADVPMWESEGQHLLTNSWLHHRSAFDLVQMGHHPGQGWPSKTDLSVNFLIPLFHPKPFLSILSGFRSSECILGSLSPSASSSSSSCSSFLFLFFLLLLIFLFKWRDSMGTSVSSWYKHANWDPER